MRIEGVKGYFVAKKMLSKYVAANEFELMLNIDHENIVNYQYFMTNKDTNESFLFKEYIDGVTLEKYIESYDYIYDLGVFKNISLQILNALIELRNNGMHILDLTTE